MQQHADDVKTVLAAPDEALQALSGYTDPRGTSGPIATVDRLLVALDNRKLDAARERLAG